MKTTKHKLKKIIREETKIFLIEASISRRSFLKTLGKGALAGSLMLALNAFSSLPAHAKEKKSTYESQLRDVVQSWIRIQEEMMQLSDKAAKMSVPKVFADMVAGLAQDIREMARGEATGSWGEIGERLYRLSVMLYKYDNPQ